MSNLLPLAPLEINDFSGGLTDFYMRGDANRAEVLDNMLITNDKQLETRAGSILYPGDFLVSTIHRRVDNFLLFNNTSELLVNQGRDIFYFDSTWTRLVGPTGNEALGAGGQYSRISSDEWNSHLFLTNDSQPIPSKIYKDQDGSYQVRTLGLPFPEYNPKYYDNTLLTTAINLANALRTSMIDHIEDLVLHNALDVYSLSYFETQTPSPSLPDPVPTPAPYATDEASLFALVKALNSVYEYHGYDAQEGTYHLNITLGVGSFTLVPPKGPWELLEDNSTPITLEQACAQLDELKKKWNWHIFGVFTHSATNDYDVINRYVVSEPDIGTIDLDGQAIITPNFSDLIRYANYLKNAYNMHASDGTYGADFETSLSGTTRQHSQFNNDLWANYITIPDATDLNSALLLIYWAWALYGRVHYQDSNRATHTNDTIDTTSSSPNYTDGPSLTVGQWVIATTAIYAGSDPYAARVTTGGTSGVLNKNAVGTVDDQAIQYSASFYHGSYTAGAFTTVTSSTVTVDEALSPAPAQLLEDQNANLPATIEAWVDRALEIFEALEAHATNAASHVASFSIINSLSGNGSFFTPQIAQYNYAFVYRSDYTIDSGVQFTVRSEPLYIGPIETCAIFPPRTLMDAGSFNDAIDNDPALSRKVEEVCSVEITNLPELVNNPNTNYDTATLEVEIYRTTDSGTTYYLEWAVDNGTNTYSDNISDATSGGGVGRLDTRETIYTTGGVLPNIQPPQARFITVNQSIGFFGYVNDGDETFKNRVVQCLPGTLDAYSPTFSVDLEGNDELKGLAVTKGNVIAFCYKSIFRLEGTYNSLGQGGIIYQNISDSLGCISSGSIVETEVGLFFAGNDGFYYTDGFQLIKVTIDLDKTYAKLTATPEQQARIKGTYDRLTRRVEWTMQSQGSSDDCDMIFVYHLNFGIKPSGVFTKKLNGTDFRPSAIIYYQDRLIRGDTRGIVFQHDTLYLTDPKFPADDGDWSDAAEWGVSYIPWKYKSCALDFGSTYKGQWVTKIHLLGENVGNVNIQINSIADNRNLTTEGKKPLAPIRYTDNPMWGDPGINWGDEDYNWVYDGKMDAKRRFTAGTLRSQLKQVEFEPAFVGVYRYDDYPEFSYASVNSTLKTATIATPTGYTSITWPLDVVGMYIAFSVDDYETEYLITAVDGDEITYSDADDTSVTASSQEWVIRGYQNEAKFSLISYVIQYASLGERGRVYEGKTSRGENNGD